MMLELEKFGLVEMSLEEKKEVDGGLWPLVWRAICALYAANEIGQEMYEGFLEEWKKDHPKN